MIFEYIDFRLVVIQNVLGNNIMIVVLNAKCYNLPKLLDKGNTLFDTCDYSSINDLPTEIDNYNFKVMHLNIRSLLYKN